MPDIESKTDLRFLLSQHHLRLSRLLSEVESALGGSSVVSIRDRLNRLEQGVREHLELEEAQVFPEFLPIDPHEVRVLKREHARLLEDIRACWAVPPPSPVAVRRLLDRLDAQIKREETLLHRWADEHLRQERRPAFARFLQTSSMQ